MKTKNLTRIEIRKRGIEALIKELGPGGMIKFIQEFETGYGDYTKERHQWLDSYDIDTICKEIENTRFLKKKN